jgi:hypothetical protein
VNVRVLLTHLALWTYNLSYSLSYSHSCTHLSQMKLPNSNFKAAFKLPGANTCATLQRVERLPSLRKTPSPFFYHVLFLYSRPGPVAEFSSAAQLLCWFNSPRSQGRGDKRSPNPVSLVGWLPKTGSGSAIKKKLPDCRWSHVHLDVVCKKKGTAIPWVKLLSGLSSSRKFQS